MSDVDSIAVVCVVREVHGNLTEKVRVWKKSPFLRLRLFW
jgi:hypothetical protein